MASALPDPRPPTPVRFTWDDFVALPEDDRRELVDGALLEIEVPTEQHEHIVAIIVFFLMGWARPRRAGRTYVSGYRVRVRDDRGVMPDVQFYRRENLSALGRQGVTDGRPDLVVEVISPSSARHDRITKVNWYQSLGVPEYWLVHPDEKSLQRLVLDAEGRYVIADSLTDDATFAPATFEGLEIPLAELWATPEDLAAEDDGAAPAEQETAE